jgi:small subunit ribosomal protein S14
LATKASVEKNNYRIDKAPRYSKYRTELRNNAVSPKLSDEEKDAARKKLQALPRDTSVCRTRSRCKLTGRPRGVYKKFGLSRLAFRQLALDGKLPGVTKASW